MVQQLHDLHLPVDLLQVCSIKLGLIYDLYGNLDFNGDVNYYYGVAHTRYVSFCIVPNLERTVLFLYLDTLWSSANISNMIYLTNSLK